jgi:hypothetical protein
MKETFSRIAGILALAFLAATQVARAQEPLLVNVPFDFIAGKMTLPAGEYRVQKPADDSGVLLIQRTDRGASAMVLCFAAQINAPQTQSKLIFHRYGDRYFLSQVWVAGHVRGRQLPESDKEKELALAARNEAPDQVTIIARLISPQP